MASLDITDVTLRDGLQMEARVLSTDEKVALLRLLSGCGYARLELTSFVHPKWMPQFADADAFCRAAVAAIPEAGRAGWMAFAPNERGLERLLAFPIPWVSAFVATTETFNRKNVNAGIDDTLATLSRLVATARAAGRRTRLYVSTVFGCPYEGPVPPEKALELLGRVAGLDPDEIALSDTIGVALPKEVGELVTRFGKQWSMERTALHLHNTYGFATASALVAREAGITRFDGSTGGVGGCPYAKGATGNVATEELLYAFHRAGRADRPPVAAVRAVLAALKTAGVAVRSRLADIWDKGGEPYGISQ